MKKLLALVVLLAALGAGYLYYWSPRVTLTGIRDAVLERDAASLDVHIDFAALRAQIKQALLGEMHKSENRDQGLLGNIVTGIAAGVADTLLNQLLTAQGMAAILPDPAREPERYAQERQELEQQLQHYVDSAQFAFVDIDTMHCEVVDEEGQPQTLILRRQSYKWRLVGVSKSLAQRASNMQK